MSAVFPSLRGDLIISRQELPDGVVYVVKDPTIGRFLRFKEPEYFIAQQLDGATSLDEIRERGEKQFGATLSIATLNQFAGKLQNLGLLSVSPHEPAQKASVSKPSKVGGNIFYLRFRLLDPDSLLSRAVPRLGFVFTQSFAIFSLAVISFAIGVLILSWQEIHHSLPRLFQPGALALAWFTLIGVVVGHEFAHGLTCKRFGGSVREIGLLLIYFQPAMYCNVSDAWLFPEKYKRLLVTLAGAWFEIFCWALATILWRLTEPATIPNFLFLVMATALGIKSLFNLNPLIKLDGYYLLSDYLEIPNLRANAFQHIGASISGLFRPGHRSSEQNPRKRRIYWIYGLLAGVYSGWLLGFILLSLGTFLVARYQGWGGAFFAGFLIIIFRGTLRKTGRLLASFFSGSTRIIQRVKRLAKLALVLALIAAGLYFIKTDFKISGEFTILPIHNAEIRPEVEGIIEEIVRDEGDVVNAGDLIARLSDRDYRAELDKVTAEFAEKQARLRMLKAGARAEELELARTTVTKGEERVKHSKSLLEMEKTLYDDKLSSKKDFEVAAEIAALRQSELEESKGTLKLLQAGARPEEIEAIQAEVARLSSQIKYLQGQLERLRILSPITGVVTTHRLKERLGTNLKKGELFAQVHQVQTVDAEIAVPENEISEVRIGQPVMLKARAYIDRSFMGKVISTSPVGIQSTNGIAQRHFIVVTELENNTQLLRPEMTGNAKISCGNRHLYQIVFRRLIRFIRVEFWSWW